MTVFGYDPAGRLISADPATSRTLARSGIPYSSDWSLDGNGNWIYHDSNLDAQGQQTANLDFSADNFNAYTQAGGQSMTYDANGNLTVNGLRGQTLKWDAFNRLVQVRDANDLLLARYLYDAGGFVN